MQQALEETGRLDVYFANAGISHLKPPAQEGGPPQLIVDVLSGTRTAADISAAEFSEVMRVNALSVFLALKYAVPAMQRTSEGKKIPQGSVISTASVAGVNANGGPLPYSATKAAVINMTKSAAYEAAGKNVRINCICPGLIRTDMTKTIFDIAALAGVDESVGQLNPLQRHGLPEGEPLFRRGRSPRLHEAARGACVSFRAAAEVQRNTLTNRDRPGRPLARVRRVFVRQRPRARRRRWPHGQHAVHPRRGRQDQGARQVLSVMQRIQVHRVHCVVLLTERGGRKGIDGEGMEGNGTVYC